MQHSYGFGNYLKRGFRNLQPSVEGRDGLLADIFAWMGDKIVVRPKQYLSESPTDS